MPMQMIDAAVVTTPRGAQATGWQTRAVEEYEQSFPDKRTQLRKDLAGQLLGLTGRPLPLENVYVDADGSLAVAGVDGETFRLYRQDGLVLVRPCAHCGTGSFESPKITDRADLGYALLAWCPLHEDCEDYDASETLADW
jgi:hypothetical protein